jgi:hypothetical protein
MYMYVYLIVEVVTQDRIKVRVRLFHCSVQKTSPFCERVEQILIPIE